MANLRQRLIMMSFTRLVFTVLYSQVFVSLASFCYLDHMGSVVKV